MRRLLGLCLLMVSVLGHTSGLVVTTHPLYLIARAVTQGVEQPVLLLSPNQSGHDIQLKPDQRQLLQQANLVLWFGPAYEAPLAKRLSGQSNAISLYNLNAFRLLPLRDVQGQALPNTIDPHMWLDPVNAIGVAYALAAVRAKQFPQYASLYQRNALQFKQRMLVAMAPFQHNQPAPYWSYHDAYQYIERDLKLHFNGALTVAHDLPPTVGQIKWLIDQHQRMPAQSVCLLSEANLDQAIVHRLQPVTLASVDETMLGQQDFVTGWTALAQQITQCTIQPKTYPNYRKKH